MPDLTDAARSDSRRLLLALSALLVLCALFVATIRPLAETLPEQDTEEAATAEKSEVQKLLEQLQDDSDESTGVFDLAGRNCLEINEELASSLTSAVPTSRYATLGLFFSTRTMAAAAQAYGAVRPEIYDGRPNLPFAMELHMARLEFAAGERGAHSAAIAGWAEAEVDDCLRSDAAYLDGRWAERAEDPEAALTAYSNAISLYPLNIPAHLEMVQHSLAARSFDAFVLDGVTSATVLQRLTGARRYAADLIQIPATAECRQEVCDYIGAVFYNWAGRKPAALAMLDRLDARCATRDCLPEVVEEAEQFREKLAAEPLSASPGGAATAEGLP